MSDLTKFYEVHFRPPELDQLNFSPPLSKRTSFIDEIRSVEKARWQE